MSDDLAILQSYIDRCSNWGRWGADDQLGTINLITPEKVREAAGLVKTGKTVHNWTARIVTRGVFVDLAADRGVESLELGYAITTDDLEEYLDANGLEIRSGDALLIRTGFMTARRGCWGDYAGGPSPGLSLHTAPWLHDRDIAAVATDTWGIEVLPSEIDCWEPLHIVCLVHTGLAFGEIFDLDTLSADSRADGVYEFMFAASPLPLSGASGSPVAAMAIK